MYIIKSFFLLNQKSYCNSSW